MADKQSLYCVTLFIYHTQVWMLCRQGEEGLVVMQAGQRKEPLVLWGFGYVLLYFFLQLLSLSDRLDLV